MAGVQGSCQHHSWVVHQSKDIEHLKRLTDLTQRRVLGISSSLGREQSTMTLWQK